MVCSVERLPVFGVASLLVLVTAEQEQMGK